MSDSRRLILWVLAVGLWAIAGREISLGGAGAMITPIAQRSQASVLPAIATVMLLPPKCFSDQFWDSLVLLKPGERGPSTTAGTFMNLSRHQRLRASGICSTAFSQRRLSPLAVCYFQILNY